MANDFNKGSFTELTCAECLGGAGLTFDFSFVFQPIVDIKEKAFGLMKHWSGVLMVNQPFPYLRKLMKKIVIALTRHVV